MPILGAAGAENWHFGVAIPMEITSLGSFRNADVPISSEAHVRSGNLVSDSQSLEPRLSIDHEVQLLDIMRLYSHRL